MIPPPSSTGEALAQCLAKQARADISQDLSALNVFVETHGSFAEMVRDHYATIDGDPSSLTTPPIADLRPVVGNGGSRR